MVHTGPAMMRSYNTSLAYVLRWARGPCGVDAGRLGRLIRRGLLQGRPPKLRANGFSRARNATMRVDHDAGAMLATRLIFRSFIAR